MSKIIVRSLIAAAMLTSAAHAATLSSNIGDYVLLAIDELHAKSLMLSHGDVGVNDPAKGRIISNGPFDAPSSIVGAREVRFNNRDPRCGGLVANVSRGTDAGCDNPMPFTAPFADVPAACGFPAPLPACDPSRPVHVAAGETVVLDPGVYGSLELDGGPRGSGTVVLGGDYVFCDIGVGRDASIEFGGPSVVSVVENVKIGRSSAVMGGAIDPETVRFFIGGDAVTIVQRATVTGVFCAPNAKLMANHGVELNGRYIARDIRLKRSTVQASVPPGCVTNDDCDGGVCVDGTCVPPTCTDGVQNGTETDVDCGGGTCPACPDGGGCQTDSDCESGRCVDGVCVPVDATCTDGIQNGDETDVDCGGGTCPACPDGGGCQTDSDCESGRCVDGVCVPVDATCTDGIQNGDETDVDCGGGTCPTCPDGGGCQMNSDCQSGVCLDGVCQPATCTDGVRNGAETDVDCGGDECPMCPDGGGCQMDSDCQSGVCMDGVCVPATCMDGRRNGHETDVDCGGDECPMCPDGGGCQMDSDCQSGVCLDGVCQPATCTDGVQNGAETDIDCGGGVCPTCPDGGGCQTDEDCESGRCVDGVCVPVGEECGNGIIEGDEVCDGDVPCDPSSPMGAMILCAEDCLSIVDFQCPIGGDEVCGDCVDNDDDGMVDLDDPDCGCDEAAPMSLTNVRIRMQNRPRIVKRLKVRSIWAGSLPDGFDPRTDGVELQMSDANGTIYCANFEAGQWKQKNKKRLVYKAPIKRPRTSKPSNGLKLGRFKVTDDGQVIFKARGPRARVAGDVSGDVLIRVKAGDTCTASAASLRSKGRELRFP